MSFLFIADWVGMFGLNFFGENARGYLIKSRSEIPPGGPRDSRGRVTTRSPFDAHQVTRAIP